MLEIKKKEGESTGSFLYRFSKRMKQSGILREVKKKRFKSRAVNRRKVRLSAIYRLEKNKELAEQRKYGFAPPRKNK